MEEVRRRRLRRLVLLFVLLLVGCQVQSAKFEDVWKIDEPTVQILCEGQGSGICFYKRRVVDREPYYGVYPGNKPFYEYYILTAWHVIADSPDINFVTAKSPVTVVWVLDKPAKLIPLQGIIMSCSEAFDTAIIHVETDLDLPAFSGFSYKPKKYDTISIVGSPSGIKPFVGEGKIVDIQEGAILAQVPIWFGNSGGPVFDDRGIIGIAVGAIASGYHMNNMLAVIVPMSDIRK